MTKLLINSDRKVLASQRGKIYKAPPSSLKKLLDTTKSTYNLFYGYQGTSVDDLIQYSDTENVTNMKQMFYSCKNLQEIPLIDTSKVTNMDSMVGYSQIVTIPPLDTRNVTNMSDMFYQCSSLQTIPQINTSKVTNTSGMFDYCPNLQTIPQLDTSKVTNMQNMFNGCYNLTTIPQLNMINAIYVGNGIFNNCKVLTNLTLLNIKVDLTIGSGTSYGHLLTLDSVINTVMELWNYSDGSKSPTLTMGSANLEKIANTYVLVTDETTDKMTAEVCDSTTEGAITLQAFAELKGWTLA